MSYVGGLGTCVTVTIPSYFLPSHVHVAFLGLCWRSIRQNTYCRPTTCFTGLVQYLATFRRQAHKPLNVGGNCNCNCN